MSDKREIANGEVLPGLLDAKKPGTLTYVGAVNDAGDLDFDLSRAMFMFAGRVVEIRIEDRGAAEEVQSAETQPPPAPTAEIVAIEPGAHPADSLLPLSPGPGAMVVGICGYTTAPGEFCELERDHAGAHGRRSRVPGKMTGSEKGEGT